MEILDTVLNALHAGLQWLSMVGLLALPFVAVVGLAEVVNRDRG